MKNAARAITAVMFALTVAGCSAIAGGTPPASSSTQASTATAEASLPPRPTADRPTPEPERATTSPAPVPSETTDQQLVRIVDFGLSIEGNGYALTTDALRVTQDYGETWRSAPTNGVAVSDILGVDVAHWPTVRFAHLSASSKLLLETSADGGSSWTTESLPSAYNDGGLGAVQIVAAGDSVAVEMELPSSTAVSSGRLLTRSEDGWSSAETPIFGKLTWLDGGSTWYLAGGNLDDRLYRSVDAGAEWTRIEAAPPSDLQGYRSILSTPASRDGRVSVPVILVARDSDGPVSLLMYGGPRDATTLEPESNRVTLAGDGSGAASAAAGQFVLVGLPRDHGLQVSSDGGQTFAPVALDAAKDPHSSGVTGLAVTPDGHAWAVVFQRGCLGEKTSCYVNSYLYTSTDMSNWSLVEVEPPAG